MSKKLFALLCAVICAASLCCPAFAERGYNVILADMEGVLSVSQQADLINIMQSTSDKIDVNIGVVITSQLNGMNSEEYADDFLYTYFGAGTNSIVLLMCEDHTGVDMISLEGRAADDPKYNIDRMFDALYDGFDRAGYYAGIESFCKYLENCGDGGSSGSGGIYAEAGYNIILADMEGRLSVNQQESLIGIMQSTADKIECNIGVVITSQLEGKNSETYAYDFLKTHFGAGSSSIVLLMCEDHINVDMITLDGRAADDPKYNIDRMFDALYDGYDRAGYHAGIESFCKYLQKSGSPVANSGSAHFNAMDMIDIMQDLAFPIIIALIAAVIVTFSFTRGYSKKAPISARQYMDNNRTRFLRRDDVFVREFTTSHSVSSSSSSGGHGGHRSGGGRSRGGHRSGGGRRR